MFLIKKRSIQRYFTFFAVDNFFRNSLFYDDVWKFWSAITISFLTKLYYYNTSLASQTANNVRKFGFVLSFLELKHRKSEALTDMMNVMNEP